MGGMMQVIDNLFGRDDKGASAAQKPENKFEKANMPTDEDYRKISGGPLKDAISLYKTADANAAMRALETREDLSGVSKAGEKMIVEALAPKLDKKLKRHLVAIANGVEPGGGWDKKVQGMTGEQARQFMIENVGGREFQTVTGALHRSQVNKTLSELPLSKDDIAALTKNGYKINPK